MFLDRLASRTAFGRLAHPLGQRMASTITGKSGRVYAQSEVLQQRQDPNLNIFKAYCGDRPFVFKRVPEPIYNLSLYLTTEFTNSRRLRIHVDSNEQERILIYPYYKDTLLALIKKDPKLHMIERRKILRCVGEAVQELHHKDWIHIDIKPDNILVNWTCDNQGNMIITDVVLGDFDIAFKSENEKPCNTPYAIGNAMWRSPEGQTGESVTKASDIYSFGLVCIYAVGGGSYLILHDYKDLMKLGVPPEQEVLTRHFFYWGPVEEGHLPEGLLKKITNDKWRDALEGALELAIVVLEDRPGDRFEQWGASLGPEAINMISGMVNLGPGARPSIDQVLAHEWWQGIIE
ncbi:kinase-like domain-containing protein [Nemania sp. FL0916]|nr:kinase-like domain-containing protein [Nemania sp. FL0916]